MSADEASMASPFNKGYLIQDGTDFWLMTPGNHYSVAEIDRSFGVIGEDVDDLQRLRPVVSLKSGITIKAGDGQKTNPYIVE